MVVVEPTGILDLWNTLVVNTFGGFWLAVFSLTLFMIIILMFGRLSIYSIILFAVMFFFSMTLGYGVTIINVVLTVLLVGGFIYSFVGWLTRAGQ